MFPPEIAELRNKNISFSTKTSKIGNNHEGGDFKLENQIQNIKALAPKGKKDEEMWKKIMRCSKDVTLVVQHGKKLLGLDERCSDRFTSVIPEIVKWRAYLRYSDYLETDSIQVVNMSGEPLNNSLVDFSHILDDESTGNRHAKVFLLSQYATKM